jgi:class 3 adenylate cyclase
MSKREPTYNQKTEAPDLYWLRKSLFRRFNPSLLGLADILENNETFDGLAVILDLKDFTGFCDQRDPHLVVPEFLDKFMNWLFARVSQEFFEREDGMEVVLWSHLPIFGKFLGDGVLLLWDVTDISREARRNIVQAFDVICNDYEKVFLKQIKGDFTRPPVKLRCGIAQGQVTSIANGGDYTGLCINIASRLQKLGEGAFSFAFAKSGLDDKAGANWYSNFTLIRIPIRGIANSELVYVLRKEHRAISKEQQREWRVK